MLFKAWQSLGLQEANTESIKGRKKKNVQKVKDLLVNSSRHGKVMGSKRPRDVEEDTTLAAHVLLIIAGFSNTGSAVHWGRVSAALSLSVPGQPDVATLAPSGSPAVPHNPVVALSSVGAVADKLHGVVKSNVAVIGTPREDTRAVSTPGRSIHSDTERSNLSKMGHDGILVVGGKSVVASDSNNRGGVGEVVHAVSILSGGSRGVRIVSLGNVAEQLDVSVTKLRDGSIAASGAST